MRKIFEKSGGNLGKPGAVAFGFSHKGHFMIEGEKTTEDQLMEIALEAGAEDVAETEGGFEVTTQPSDYLPVREAIEAAGIELASAELTLIPSTTVSCDAETAEKVVRLIDTLEDHDDVQKVYTNADLPDEVMQ